MRENMRYAHYWQIRYKLAFLTYRRKRGRMFCGTQCRLPSVSALQTICLSWRAWRAGELFMAVTIFFLPISKLGIKRDVIYRIFNQ